MERIGMLLQKIADLSRDEKNKSAIDVDLMLDYTRVLYADLLEWRARLQEMPLLSADKPEGEPALPPQETPATTVPEMTPEPTPTEINTAMEQAHAEVVATNMMTAPSIELGQNVQHFEESENDHIESHTFILQGMNTPAAPRRAQDEFHRLIGINDKYQFISELFSNNKESYDTVIAEMNEFDNFEQAQEWLKLHIADNFGWDDESDTVQSFYKLLEKFFRER